MPDLSDGQVLLRTVYLSLDPYMRGRMSAAESYADPVEVGDVMVGGTVSRVLESRNPRIAAGTYVLGYTGWQTHAVVDGDTVRPSTRTVPRCPPRSGCSECPDSRRIRGC